jgi:lysozyme family protein
VSGAFPAAFLRTVGAEGRYSNNPSDSGGETMFGITIATARANGYAGPMKSLPLEVAKAIYRFEFWDVMKLDAVADLAPRLALELFDSGVNVGTGVAGAWLQRALNACNKRGSLFADMPEDGRIGNVTLAALRSLVALRGKRDAENVLLRACDSQQGTHYLGLTRTRQKDEDFYFGWMLNRVGEGA